MMKINAVHGIIHRLAIPVAFVLVTAVAGIGTVGSAPASAAEPGPQWVKPVDGNQIYYLAGDLVFKVAPVAGSVGYLFGFDVNGVPVWENYAKEHHLNSTVYTIPYASSGWLALGNYANHDMGTWHLHGGARAYISDGNGNYHWSEQSDVNVTVVGFDLSNLRPDVSWNDIAQALKCGVGVAGASLVGDLANLYDAIEVALAGRDLAAVRANLDKFVQELIVIAVDYVAGVGECFRPLISPTLAG
jgi:hypothetical protein